MKKYIAYIMAATLIGSCSDDDTKNVSTITNYPIVTINGDATVLVSEGTDYTELGAVAVEGESEIDTNVSYSSGVYWGATGIDTNSPDRYTVTYSATNQDGFDGNALRDVWVANTGDLTTSIEGLYLSSVQRAPDFKVSSQYTDMTYVIIKKTGTNTYEISHAIGGYYDFGRAYGSGYAARGAVITANDIASNDFSISQAQFPVWGNTVDITEFTVDSANKQITFTGDGNFGNGTFKVQLTQVQL